jgi:hypothetical protein
MNPWTVMPFCLDGGRFTIVGFGNDYLLATIEDDCPGCISGGGIQALTEILAQVNCVFIYLHGFCGLKHPENHMYLSENQARKIFPPANDDWWKTQRGKSLCPKNYKELKQLIV